MYSQGLGTETDCEKAISLLSQASSDNNTAMAALRETYHSINNEIQKFSKVFECYKNVEEDNHNKSFALRGNDLLYEYGDNVENNYRKSSSYYRQSGDRKNKGVYYNLVLIYYYEKRVEKSFGVALELFNQVIVEEPRKGYTYMFVKVENDTEYDLSTKKQRKYSMVSESFIYGEAHYYLGLMYTEGQGTDKNQEKALSHFKIAHLYETERAQKLLDLKV